MQAARGRVAFADGRKLSQGNEELARPFDELLMLVGNELGKAQGVILDRDRLLCALFGCIVHHQSEHGDNGDYRQEH